MDFFVEAVEIDGGFAIYGNDFGRTEIIEFADFKGCVPTMDTLAS